MQCAYGGLDQRPLLEPSSSKWKIPLLPNSPRLTSIRLMNAWLFRSGSCSLCMLVGRYLPSLCRLMLKETTDISFHAIPSIVMLVDLLFLSPPWTITILPSLGLSSTIAFGYWFWVERCFKYNGWYVGLVSHVRLGTNSLQVSVSDLRSPPYPRPRGALFTQRGRDGPEYSYFEVAVWPRERLRGLCPRSIPSRGHQAEGGSMIVSVSSRSEQDRALDSSLLLVAAKARERASTKCLYRCLDLNSQPLSRSRTSASGVTFR